MRKAIAALALVTAVTAFGGHSKAPLIITEIADAPDPAERYVELFTAGPFTPKWLSRSKSEIFTKTEKTSETVAIMVTEDDLSPNSQFLLVCADRDAFVAKYDLACNVEAPDFFEDFDGDVRVAIQEIVDDNALGPIVDKYGGFAINETLQHYYHAAAEAVASAASTTGKTASEDTSIIAATESSTSGSAGETDAEADSFVASASLGLPEGDTVAGLVTNTIDVMAGTGDEQALSSSGEMSGEMIFAGGAYAGAISSNEIETNAESGSVGAEVSSEMDATITGYKGGPVVNSFTSNAEDYVAAGTDNSLGSYTSLDVSGGADSQGPLHTSGVVVSEGGSAANDAGGSFDGTMKGELGLDDSGGETNVENYVAGSAEAGQASAASDSLLEADLYAGGDLAAADFYVGAGTANSAGDASTDGRVYSSGGAAADGTGAGAGAGSGASWGVSGVDTGLDVKSYADSTSGLGPGDAAYAGALGKAISDGDVTEERAYFPDRRLDVASADAGGGVGPGEAGAGARGAAAIQNDDILCPGNLPPDFCNCGSDCTDPGLCSCPDAVACCAASGVAESETIAETESGSGFSVADVDNDLKLEGNVAIAGGDLAEAEAVIDADAFVEYDRSGPGPFSGANVDTDAAVDADSVTPDGDANVESRQDADAWLEKFSPEPDVEVVASGFDLDTSLQGRQEFGAQCLGQTACLAGSPCATGEFCNFDFPGFCEQCSSYSDSAACYNDGLPSEGAADCVACCFDGGYGVTTGKTQGDLDSWAEIVEEPGFQGAFAGVDTDAAIDQTAISSNAEADTKTRADGDMNIESTTENVFGQVDLDITKDAYGEYGSVGSIDEVTAKIRGDSDSGVYRSSDVKAGTMDLDMSTEAESISETPVETGQLKLTSQGDADVDYNYQQPGLVADTDAFVGVYAKGQDGSSVTSQQVSDADVGVATDQAGPSVFSGSIISSYSDEHSSAEAGVAGSANLNGAESPETTARAETGILALAAAASANPDDASAAAAASATAEGTTTDAAAQSSADAEASIGSTATADASSSIAGGNPVTEIFTFASGQAGSNRAEAGATMGASANASEAGQAATSTGGALGASELSAAKTLGFGQNEFFFGDGTDSTHDFKDGRAVRACSATEANPDFDQADWRVERPGEPDYNPGCWCGHAAPAGAGRRNLRFGYRPVTCA